MRHCRSLASTGFVILVVLGLALPGAALAEDPSDPQVELVTTQPLSLQDFLKAVGRVADLPFLWDPGTRELGRAEFVAAMNLRSNRSELFGIVRSILATYDLALVPVGPAGHEVHRVVAVSGLGGAATLRPRGIELDARNRAEYRRADGLLVTTTLGTRHVRDLASVRSALLVHATRGGVGRVEVLPDLPGFAVTDFAPAVVAMADALQQIDVPPPEPREPARITKRIELEHADAAETALGLADHLAANRPLPTGEALTPTQREEPVLGLRILPDERTNALLVSGSPERVGEVEEAVTLLDVPAARPSVWIHVLPLEHLDAVETAQVLRELVAKGDALRAGGDGAGPTIVPAARTNALLVEATPKAYELLLGIVEQLDTPPPEQDGDAGR